MHSRISQDIPNHSLRQFTRHSQTCIQSVHNISCHEFKHLKEHSQPSIQAFCKTFPVMHPSSFQDDTVMHPVSSQDILSHPFSHASRQCTRYSQSCTEFLHSEEVPTMHLGSSSNELWQKVARIFHGLVTMTSLFSALFALAFKYCDAV
jgi:hypothetical protein